MSPTRLVGGAITVTNATVASELEQPDKTEPTVAIPKAEGHCPVPAARFRFLLYPFHEFSSRALISAV
jgi:hypothetical protein